MRRLVALAALTGAAFVAGVVAQDRRWSPAPQIAGQLRDTRWNVGPEAGFRDSSGREVVDCARLREPGTAVLLTLGQSNAANESELGFQPSPGVYNFNYFDGRCYAARDPLLGATGDAGSVWSRLGDALVREGRYSRVLIVPIAVGGSRIETWTPEGRHFRRVAGVVERLEAQGLRPTHVLWHQGESDARWTGRDEYIERFGRLLAGLRGLGVEAPVYVAVASVCVHPGSEAIRAAQREIPQRFAGVFAGPDTDALDRLRWRRDGCHFSNEGLELHAQLWLEAMNH